MHPSPQPNNSMLNKTSLLVLARAMFTDSQSTTARQIVHPPEFSFRATEGRVGEKINLSFALAYLHLMLFKIKIEKCKLPMVTSDVT